MRIYLAKARLLTLEKRHDDAQKYIEKAKMLVPQLQIDRFNEYVNRMSGKMPDL